MSEKKEVTETEETLDAIKLATQLVVAGVMWIKGGLIVNAIIPLSFMQTIGLSKVGLMTRMARLGLKVALTGTAFVVTGKVYDKIAAMPLWKSAQNLGKAKIEELTNRMEAAAGMIKQELVSLKSDIASVKKDSV